jgi:hypothetical protein
MLISRCHASRGRAKIAFFAVLLICLLPSKAPAQWLDLPPRPLASSNGSDFARSIADLSLEEREREIVAEVMKGNVPGSFRNLMPVTVTDGPVKLTFHVTPDYLTVGSDNDYFLTPLSPSSAQNLADRLGCTLPTPKMVDAIWFFRTFDDP